jgi:ribosome-associated toxin RatA of RatAB toxin-antitoxin module
MALLAPFSKADATIAAEPSVVYEILTDYDAYLEWVPLVTQSKLLAVEGDLALAEVEVGKPFSDKLVFECIHDKNRQVLARAISGSLPVAKIEWNIEPAGDKQSKVSVSIAGKSNWHWALPGWRKLLGAQRYLTALQGQAGSYSEISVSSGGETILDLMDTSEGMVLVYRGQKYTLQAVPQRQS